MLCGCSLLGQSGRATQAEPPAAAEAGIIHPARWPQGQSGVARDSAIEADVARLLSRMSVEEKVGQTIQADIGYVTPDDVRRYHLGSILNGGNSGPHRDDRAPAADWLKAADAFFNASLPESPDRPRIPLIWGTDSMHGNSNIVGATIFPHNIGLGAARDPELVREIGRITAIETRVTGADWVFAPVVAVARDVRWGRTYESYSEDPDLVRADARALIEGLQGLPSDPDFLRGGRVIATAKHFIADGGTDKGKDQGDSLADEDELLALYAPPYEAAISAGVQSVMVSYSSWRGEKMHASKTLVGDVLKGRMGFDGIVVGDWNGYAQIPGCDYRSCPAVYEAGVDVVMAPDHWRSLYESTLAQVRSGEIPAARLDDAVSRILRVKLRAGIMDAGPPSSRPYAGQWEQLGSRDHRAVARRAVRESLVLLKNDGAVLPLDPKRRVLVAGSAADDLAAQCGGWTISWQGTGNSRADFPGGQTVFEAVRDQVAAAGGTATLSTDGTFETRPDVAIVVFGEAPYAEFSGDRDDLSFESSDLETMRGLRAQGIPVVAVLLSGRPLYVTPQINASDAFVAAWLPGAEGGGVADMLFRQADGSVAHDFRGTLSFSWPRAPDQAPLNAPRPSDPAAMGAAYRPLFAFGYGLDYAHPRDIGPLPEAGEDKTAALGANVRAMR